MFAGPCIDVDCAASHWHDGLLAPRIDVDCAVSHGADGLLVPRIVVHCVASHGSDVVCAGPHGSNGLLDPSNDASPDDNGATPTNTAEIEHVLPLLRTATHDVLKKRACSTYLWMD